MALATATADNDLDRELLQIKQENAAAAAGTTGSALQRVRRFLKPPREELEAMPFGQRMRYEAVNSFLQVCVCIFVCFVGVHRAYSATQDSKHSCPTGLAYPPFLQPLAPQPHESV